jgi:hypothetical protein
MKKYQNWTKTKNMLTIHGQHHPREDTDLYTSSEKRKWVDADRRNPHSRIYVNG